ncbi:MAG TPA: Trm112 family protein [Actinomycetota bacterium]|nr:Trm112 family protein [Actinomycetota bacterium]
MDPELVSLLICPNCRGETELRKKEQVIACLGTCGYRYPVVKGIPHMLVSEAIKD